jgi:hypothetical protein
MWCFLARVLVNLRTNRVKVVSKRSSDLPDAAAVVLVALLVDIGVVDLLVRN